MSKEREPLIHCISCVLTTFSLNEDDDDDDVVVVTKMQHTVNVMKRNKTIAAGAAAATDDDNISSSSSSSNQTMFMVLPSSQIHCESSLGSSCECGTAPSGGRLSDLANQLIRP